MCGYICVDLACAPGVLTRNELVVTHNFVNDVQYGMDVDYYAYTLPRTYPACSVSAG